MIGIASWSCGSEPVASGSPHDRRRAIMRRLYFLAPDTATAQAIVDDLLRARITWRHIHVLANHSVGLERLPEASLLQRSDVVHALERGVMFGAATGAIVGLVALMFPPANFDIT